MSSAQINMCYIISFVFMFYYIVFYDVIPVYSGCSIVLRVRNKGDDYDVFDYIFCHFAIERSDIFRILILIVLHIIYQCAGVDVSLCIFRSF